MELFKEFEGPAGVFKFVVIESSEPQGVREWKVNKC